MKIFTKQLFITIISSSILTIASPESGAQDPDEVVRERGRDCISQSSIRDYQILDDRNLIVRAGVKRYYHVELYRRAYGMRGSWSIGFKSFGGRVCGGSGDVVVADGFGRKESIGIRSIRELAAEERDELLVAFGKKEPEFEQTPEAEPVEGAEVEELD